MQSNIAGTSVGPHFTLEERKGSFKLQNSCCDLVTYSLFISFSSRGLLEVRNLEFTELSGKTFQLCSLYRAVKVFVLQRRHSDKGWSLSTGPKFLLVSKTHSHGLLR